MTEQEYLSCTDPARMLNKLTTWLQDDPVRPETVLSCRPPSERKLRLFIEAIAEQCEKCLAIASGWDDSLYRLAEYVADANCLTRASKASFLRDIFGNPFHEWILTERGEKRWNSIISWYNGIIPRIAQTIFDERRFEDMTILADALEEAGCANAEILWHCRGWELKPCAEGVGLAWQPFDIQHVRGCWAIDLLLGKG